MIQSDITTARKGLLCTVVYTLLCFALAQSVCAQEGGYCTPRSVAIGDSIHFHISTTRDKFDLSVYRYGKGKQLVTTIRDCNGGLLPVPESSFVKGCRWPVTQSMLVKSDWQSGVYCAEFPADSSMSPIVFVVRQRVAGEKSKTVVSLDAATWQAYNNFGGKSLYHFNSTHDTAARCVSFERPLSAIPATHHDQYYERFGAKLTAWLTEEHIAAEYIFDTDIDADPTLLTHYDVFCVVGHDEYWSRPERDAAQDFLAAGKKIIILGGNTCWWQTRYSDSAQTVTCYKDPSYDPLYGIRNDLVTVNWSDTPVDEPENTLTGVSWRMGGYVNNDTFLTKADGFGAYRVWNAHHWIYRGTGLDDGEYFGFEHSIVGYEVDGAKFQWNSGFPMPTGQDDSPQDFQLLGISPATVAGAPPGLRHATMGMFTTPIGGAVFNAATTNWVDGLDDDVVVRQITKNVFKRFAGGKLAPTVKLWFPFRTQVDTVSHEAQFCNLRRINIHKGDTTMFNVIAEDPLNDDLTYEWRVNGDVVWHEAQYACVWSGDVFDDERNATVEVRVRNGYDSTTLKWEVYQTARLKIVSHPHTEEQKPKSKYTYKIDVVTAVKGTVHYTLLKSPEWLKLDEGGVLTGTISEAPGNYDVVVRAHDEIGNSDTQAFTVKVGAPSLVNAGDNQPVAGSLAAYPNPVLEHSLITCLLSVSATASLNIVSSDGRIVRTVMNAKHVTPGSISATWDRKNDSGDDVSNGAYWAVLKVQTDGNKERVFTHEIRVAR